MAPAFGGASFAFQTPTVSLVFGVVEARFIAINPLVVLKLCSFRVVGWAFLRVAFGVAIGLCLRVPPIRLSARPIVSALMAAGHSWALSAGGLSPC
jgi:hypothetical protein